MMGLFGDLCDAGMRANEAARLVVISCVLRSCPNGGGTRDGLRGFDATECILCVSRCAESQEFAS